MRRMPLMPLSSVAMRKTSRGRRIFWYSPGHGNLARARPATAVAVLAIATAAVMVNAAAAPSALDETSTVPASPNLRRPARDSQAAELAAAATVTLRQQLWLTARLPWPAFLREAAWRVPCQDWPKFVVSPFDRDAARAALCASANATHPRSIDAIPSDVNPHVAAHWAADSANLPMHTHLRWLLPVQFPAYVLRTAHGTAPLVFFQMDAGWRALRSIDAGLQALVWLASPIGLAWPCLQAVTRAHTREPCASISALVVQRAASSLAIGPTCALAIAHCTRTD